MANRDGANKEPVQEDGRPTNILPTNVFENITAAKASTQVIASTVGIAISAQTIASHKQVLQCLGQLADTSIVQLSQDHRARIISREEDEDEQDQVVANFEDAHGPGRRI